MKTIDYLLVQSPAMATKGFVLTNRRQRSIEIRMATFLSCHPLYIRLDWMTTCVKWPLKTVFDLGFTLSYILGITRLLFLVGNP